MDLELQGRRAVVTGASRGIGRAIALCLAAEGASVTAVARNREKLTDLARAEAGSRAGSITPLAADLSKPDELESLAPALESADVFVFNTGGPPFGTAADISDESWNAQFQAMFLSAIRLTRFVLPGMRKRNFGRILLVVSSGVVQPIPNLAISNALRAALVGWAKTLAGEVAAEGVTVNCLAPGRIATDRVVEFDQNRARRDGIPVEEVQRQSRAAIPAGRYGDPDEFAAVAAFVASPKSSYLTGSVIRIDGGLIRSL
jgi:3-oxoacyl-[acyl-carrier protein] reductase